jgi:hypothetical protein
VNATLAEVEATWQRYYPPAIYARVRPWVKEVHVLGPDGKFPLRGRLSHTTEALYGAAERAIWVRAGQSDRPVVHEFAHALDHLLGREAEPGWDYAYSNGPGLMRGVRALLEATTLDIVPSVYAISAPAESMLGDGPPPDMREYIAECIRWTLGARDPQSEAFARGGVTVGVAPLTLALLRDAYGITPPTPAAP